MAEPVDVNHSLFQIAWASPSEKNGLLFRLQRMQRQTMNIRLMQDARFIVLKQEDGAIFGWGGLDYRFNPEFPELFSLYLDPAYRKTSLGMLIELARCSHLLNEGHKQAFVRMTEDEAGADLLGKRLASGFYSTVPRTEIDARYADLCHGCELFDKACTRQVFLKFDIAAFRDQCEKEIGQFTSDLPKWFRLVRIAGQARRVSGAHEANNVLWKSYRPLWLHI